MRSRLTLFHWPTWSSCNAGCVLGFARLRLSKWRCTVATLPVSTAGPRSATMDFRLTRSFINRCLLGHVCTWLRDPKAGQSLLLPSSGQWLSWRQLQRARFDFWLQRRLRRCVAVVVIVCVRERMLICVCNIVAGMLIRTIQDMETGEVRCVCAYVFVLC